ncbi:unnamed protein product [Tilletia controversa]|nr:unnamed protein product [Tilletia controversa]
MTMHGNGNGNGNGNSRQTYTPIVWSADPDGPTVLTTPSPITLRPQFFTPLPQSTNQHDAADPQSVFRSAGNLGPQQGPPLTIYHHGEMPPPPARVKKEESSFANAMGQGQAQMSHHPQQQQQPSFAPPSHPPPHQQHQQHHQQQQQQQQHQQQQHHHHHDQHHQQHFMQPSFAPQSQMIPSSHSSQNATPVPSPIFDPGAFARLPSPGDSVASMGMGFSSAPAVAFSLEPNAQNGFDLAQQQPRDWSSMMSNSNSASGGVEPAAMGVMTPVTSISVAAQNLSLPNTLENAMAAAVAAAADGRSMSSHGHFNQMGPGSGGVAHFGGMGSEYHHHVAGNATGDVHSPFAYNTDRPQTGGQHTSYLAHPGLTSSSSSSSHDLDNRLRTSPSSNTMIGMGMGVGMGMGNGASGDGSGHHSLSTFDRLRRPHTAAPQGSDRKNLFKNGQLFFQKNALVGSTIGSGGGGGEMDCSGDKDKDKEKKGSRFVQKLYTMVHDPECQHLICWNPKGTSVVIVNFDEFAKDVLGKHFKHSNFSSFVRQLNMYGFYKVNKVPRGSRSSSSAGLNAADGLIWEFSHPKFQRNRPDLLDEIKRRAIEHDSSRNESKGEMPLSAHAQANAFFSAQVNELTVKVDELNIGLGEAGERNAHLRALNGKLREALQSTLGVLRQQFGGTLPDVLAQHEGLLTEAPAPDRNQAAFLQSPTSRADQSPERYSRARTNTDSSQMSTGPSNQEATSTGQNSLPLPPIPLTTLSTRGSRGTIMPLPAPSVLGPCPDRPVSPIKEDASLLSSRGDSLTRSASRATLTVDTSDVGMSSTAGSTDGYSICESATNVFGNPPASLLSASSIPFAPPSFNSSASSENGSAPRSERMRAHTFITANASVDSLQSSQPSKQQRTMPSTVSGMLPPRSSSLMAAFESAVKEAAAAGAAAIGSSASASACTSSTDYNFAKFSLDHGASSPHLGGSGTMSSSHAYHQPQQQQQQSLMSSSASSSSMMPSQGSIFSGFTGPESSTSASTRSSLMLYGAGPGTFGDHGMVSSRMPSSPNPGGGGNKFGPAFTFGEGQNQAPYQALQLPQPGQSGFSVLQQLHQQQQQHQQLQQQQHIQAPPAAHLSSISMPTKRKIPS